MVVNSLILLMLRINLVLLTLLLSSCILIGANMSKIEQPEYTLIKTYTDAIETRVYAPMLIAEVEVSGESRKRAISAGFQVIARYIFGDNIAQGKIAMTSPVQQQQSQKIAMTSPVQQQLSAVKADKSTWKVSFVMPSKFSLDTIPKPNNDKIKLIEVPEKRYIVLRFSGLMSESNLNKHIDKLRQFVKTHHLSTQGEIKYAFYNPPWTLPFLRRNEVMLPLVD